MLTPKMGGAAALAAGVGPSTATGVDSALDSLDGRVSEFTLPNGLHFIVLERRKAPIVSCHTCADVGAWDEVDGQTGMAHLLEHLAFKGTERIGTRDYRTEVGLLEAMDETFYAMRDEKNGFKKAKLAATLKQLQEEGSKLWVPNEFGAILTRNGGVGLNASTSHDSTQYYCSLPSNKLELWFAMESERFRNPVFRELYSEKEVVTEERLLRVDNSRLGPFQEQFGLDSLWARGNRYGRPVIGFQRDVDAIGREEVQRFFEERYRPSTLTITVAGDVEPAAVESLAQKYFGGWAGKDGNSSPSAHPPAPAWPEAGGGAGGKTTSTELRVSDSAGPYFMEGYYRPDALHPDAPALDLASDILSGARTARFYKNLVVPGRALAASCVAAYPSDRRASMFLTVGVPKPGEGPDQVAREIRDEMRRVVDGPVGAAEVARVKKQQRAALLGALGSNMTMATLLSRAHVVSGSWKGLLEDVDKFEAVAAGDVQDVLAKYVREDNRFSGYVDKK